MKKALFFTSSTKEKEHGPDSGSAVCEPRDLELVIQFLQASFLICKS